MRFFIPFLFLLATLPLTAETSERLDTVAGELEAIVSDLEASQVQSTELHSRLVMLESLSEEHQNALREQEKLLAEYRASVARLEAHDQAALNLASDLKGQLESEKRITGWLWPVTTVAVTLAVIEGLALGWRR